MRNTQFHRRQQQRNASNRKLPGSCEGAEERERRNSSAIPERRAERNGFRATQSESLQRPSDREYDFLQNAQVIADRTEPADKRDRHADANREHELLLQVFLSGMEELSVRDRIAKHEGGTFHGKIGEFVDCSATNENSIAGSGHFQQKLAYHVSQHQYRANETPRDHLAVIRPDICRE